MLLPQNTVLHAVKESPRKIVGVPREVKQHEYRVAMTPANVARLTSKGARVLVENHAGVGSGYFDSDYKAAGALLVDKERLFVESEVIVKVKEPQKDEYDWFCDGHIVFTFFHFAGCPGLEDEMRKRGVICFAYETLQMDDGSLPLLAPMSEIAGRLAIQEGAKFLNVNNGGSGVLLSGVPGVDRGVVVVIGAGTVGTNAALAAAGMGAQVYLLDVNIARLRQLSNIMPKNVVPVFSNEANIQEYLGKADVVVGAVLVLGKESPKLITLDMLGNMKRGSCFVDVAIDQGGMTVVSRPTTHNNPVFNVKGVNMYCVPNMPGIVPVTATQALSNATIPYVEALATMYLHDACEKFPELTRSLLV